MMREFAGARECCGHALGIGAARKTTTRATQN
jgi:hypothetical protein